MTDDEIRREFLAAGFVVKPGHDDLKPYVYEAARRVLALQSAQAQSAAPYGWVVWWLGADGQRRPSFRPGAERPTFGAELDARVPMVPVYTSGA